MENITITIYTDAEGRVHPSQNEDSTLTAHEVEQLPTIPEEPLYDVYHIYSEGAFTFGYVLNANKCYGAINDCKARLKATDYLAHKEADGEDVSAYGDFKADRIALRAEINGIENLLTTSNNG